MLDQFHRQAFLKSGNHLDGINRAISNKLLCTECNRLLLSIGQSLNCLLDFIRRFLEQLIKRSRVQSILVILVHTQPLNDLRIVKQEPVVHEKRLIGILGGLQFSQFNLLFVTKCLPDKALAGLLALVDKSAIEAVNGTSSTVSSYNVSGTFLDIFCIANGTLSW